jgi:hypothetical protein
MPATIAAICSGGFTKERYYTYLLWQTLEIEGVIVVHTMDFIEYYLQLSIIVGANEGDFR